MTEQEQQIINEHFIQPSSTDNRYYIRNLDVSNQNRGWYKKKFRLRVFSPDSDKYHNRYKLAEYKTKYGTDCSVYGLASKSFPVNTIMYIPGIDMDLVVDDCVPDNYMDRNLLLIRVPSKELINIVQQQLTGVIHALVKK